MTNRNKYFLQGVAYSAAVLTTAFDQPGMAAELLHAAGLSSPAKLRAADIDEHDAKSCRKVIREEMHKYRKACPVGGIEMWFAIKFDVDTRRLKDSAIEADIIDQLQTIIAQVKMHHRGGMLYTEDNSKECGDWGFGTSIYEHVTSRCNCT